MWKRLIVSILGIIAVEVFLVLATAGLLALRLPYDVKACNNGAFFCFPPTLVFGFFACAVFALAAIPILIFSLSGKNKHGEQLNPSWTPVIVYLLFGVALPLGVFMYNAQSWLDHTLSDRICGIIFVLSTILFWLRTPLTLRMKEWTIALTVGFLLIALIQFFTVKGASL